MKEEINFGAFSEGLNNKLDLDLENLNGEGVERIRTISNFKR